ncbi:putative ATP synthase subunit f, mitochondrial [Planococcus citri]|uniref:putative ATP synthase subunit f, mitochondrial n=1 Tax=Planococcus citri TaxID=170843 RepID=UPI0031FA02B7
MGLIPKITFGDYPAAYNPRVHGPYDPARYYGKPDTPFGQVKLGELGAWFSRRDKSVRGAAGLWSRAFWRWQHKYVQPKRVTGAWVLQTIVPMMMFMYSINFGKKLVHRHHKYH